MSMKGDFTHITEEYDNNLYSELQSLLAINAISESPYLYEGLEITYKGKKKQKYLKRYDDEF